VKIKCPNAGKDFAPEEISAQVLRKLTGDAAKFLNDSVDKAVITVPAYFNDSQRQATKDAGAACNRNAAVPGASHANSNFCSMHACSQQRQATKDAGARADCAPWQQCWYLVACRGCTCAACMHPARSIAAAREHPHRQKQQLQLIAQAQWGSSSSSYTCQQLAPVSVVVLLYCYACCH
jgi:hypothetical protein